MGARADENAAAKNLGLCGRLRPPDRYPPASGPSETVKAVGPGQACLGGLDGTPGRFMARQPQELAVEVLVQPEELLDIGVGIRGGLGCQDVLQPGDPRSVRGKVPQRRALNGFADELGLGHPAKDVIAEMPAVLARAVGRRFRSRDMTVDGMADLLDGTGRPRDGAGATGRRSSSSRPTTSPG